jgi:acetylornithine deacetylase
LISGKCPSQTYNRDFIPSLKGNAGGFPGFKFTGILPIMDVLEQLLSDLVAINSINPDLVPGAPGEAEIAHFISGWLEQAGLEVQLIESVSGRPNVIGIAHGTGDGKTLLLNGHMDTVGAGGMSHPHTPVIKEGRLYGRGAYDMKGGLAACMVAVAEARRQQLRGDVIFTAVVDEEYASLGTQELAKRYHAEGAIVAEFTELSLILAHRGFVWFEVETLGRAAHGSRPDLGVDAITKMGKFLVELEKLDLSLRSNPTHPLLGSGSIHASLIQGGKELSTYPDRCILSVERRTLPGEAPEMIKAELSEIIHRVQQSDPAFQAVIRRGLDRSPLETQEDAGIVKAIQAAAGNVLAHPFPIAGVQFWTDAALLSEAGIPSVLFGPSGSGAHADEEWVDLASVKTCADIYLATAREFCV